MTSDVVMQIDSHDDGRTLIAALLYHINRWRRAQNWSRETTAQVIVEAHVAIRGPSATGIHFDGTHPDAYTRQKNAADRIFRWLDDSSKDNNLLPANFIPSILAAMPINIRTAALNDIFRPIGMNVMPIAVQHGEIDTASMFKSLLKEQSEAQMAMADLLDGATRDELIRVCDELTDVINVATDFRMRFESVLKSGGENDRKD